MFRQFSENAYAAFIAVIGSAEKTARSGLATTRITQEARPHLGNGLLELYGS